MIVIADVSQFGRVLRDFRAIYGMSQREMADTVGTHQGRYSEWETGTTVPETATLVRIFSNLGYRLALVPDDKQEQTCASTGAPPRSGPELD